MNKNSVSEETKILEIVKPKINSVMDNIIKDISDPKLRDSFEKIFEIEKNDNSKVYAYFILELLWLYEIIRRENKKIKLSKEITKENIHKDIKMLREKCGFKIFPQELFLLLSKELIEKTIQSLETIEENYSKSKIDIRGVIFQNLLPEELRKVTGSYHTRSDAAEILASISINDSKSTVMDLSCGSGKLLVASNHRIKELNQKNINTLNQIFGVELMQIPSCLAVINLFLENPDVKSGINIANSDSLHLEPESQISMLKSNNSESKLSKVDVIIMNPPFTRQESLEKSQKDHLESRFSKYSIVDKRIGLHGYFVLQGNEFLNDGGVMALVLPATVLRIESFTKLRKFIVDNFEVKFLISSNKSSSFSYGSRFREILLVIKKTKPKKLDKIRIGVLNEKPVIGKNVKTIISSLTKKSIKNSKEMELIDIDNEVFAQNYQNLFKFISLSKEKVFDTYEKIYSDNKKLTKFNEYCKEHDHKLVRGWETLRSLHPVQSDYILLNKDDTDDKSTWFFANKDKTNITICNSKTSKKLKIPNDSIKFGLRRLGKINTISANNKLDYIVCKKFKEIDKFLSKPIIDNFDEWEKITHKKSSKLAFVRRFSLGGKSMSVCAIVSDDEFTPTQTMTIITHISTEDAKILALWLNSSIHILQMIVERVETEGAYMELPEWAMKKLFVINPDVLTDTQRKKILKIYEKISKIEFPSLVEQLKNGFSARDEIDQLFLDILGIKDTKIKEIQEIIKQEIDDLRSLVKASD
jgi:tRNA1(Val) A37 N6-methylase TrmN6